MFNVKKISKHQAANLAPQIWCVPAHLFWSLGQPTFKKNIKTTLSSSRQSILPIPPASFFVVWMERKGRNSRWSVHTSHPKALLPPAVVCLSWGAPHRGHLAPEKLRGFLNKLRELRAEVHAIHWSATHIQMPLHWITFYSDSNWFAYNVTRRLPVFTQYLVMPRHAHTWDSCCWPHKKVFEVGGWVDLRLMPSFRGKCQRKIQSLWSCSLTWQLWQGSIRESFQKWPCWAYQTSCYHTGKLKWNPKMEVWKMVFLFNSVTSDFLVPAWFSIDVWTKKLEWMEMKSNSPAMNVLRCNQTLHPSSTHKKKHLEHKLGRFPRIQIPKTLNISWTQLNRSHQVTTIVSLDHCQCCSKIWTPQCVPRWLWTGCP